MEYSLLIIFYYGILHALGPDHLSAIALFSIGKKKKAALLLSLLFAVGHGITLYLLALLITPFASDSLLQYGDIISSAVILLMGLYLVYLAATNKIRIDHHHHHQNDKHTHIYYEDAHLHDKTMLVSLGLLMGVGGIRGMLITLAAISHQTVGIGMVFAFILGISLVFLLFGYLIYLINARLIRSTSTLRYAVTSVGLLSIIIGTVNLAQASSAL
jgi:ABC-type nickel/cobalt efflux system permease component RcnA